MPSSVSDETSTRTAAGHAIITEPAAATTVAWPSAHLSSRCFVRTES